MYFRSFFDEELAQMSYLVGCQQTGEAIVIDPARKIDDYMKTAEKEELDIVAAAETHIHADFLSGAREFAKTEGVKLYLSGESGEDWAYLYVDEVPHQLVYDNDRFHIGHVQFDVMHTPGHTPESISFVLTDKGGGSEKPMGIFTGDFVFVGDIGRPDLLEKAAGDAGSAQVGAREMYQSLKRFTDLPDYMQLWPGHGAGSACGKSLGAVPMSTVGYEKMVNWALQDMDEATFTDTLITGQPEPPRYFAMMKKLNKEGPPRVDHRPVPQIDDAASLKKDMVNRVIVDLRPSSQFAEKHLPGSINIPLYDSFTNWAGWLVGYDKEIILIGSAENIPIAKKYLQSIGIDQITGFIEPDDALAAETESYDQLGVEELYDNLDNNAYHLIDVRNQDEWEGGKIPGAHHQMLGTLPDHLDELPDDKTYLVHCRTGRRSSIAASVLQANGFKNVKNVAGGYLAWAKENLPIEKD